MRNRIGWWWTPIKRRLGIRFVRDTAPDPERAIFLAGTARSGTTWVSELINHRNQYRYIFEPFYARKIPRLAAFGGRRYLRPTDDDPELLALAEHVLSGRIRHPWTERFNHRLVADRRLIKDIRANLFLKWLHRHFPGMPIVLVLRHPFAVALSYEKHGWRGSVESLLAQPALLEDHLQSYVEVIAEARDAFERAVCIWCVETLVPLKQFRPGELHITVYEQLLHDPEVEVARLFAFLGMTYDETALRVVRRPSLTSRRDSAIATGQDPAQSWKHRVTGERLERASEIVRRFGLDRLYSGTAAPSGAVLHSLMCDAVDADAGNSYVAGS